MQETPQTSDINVDPVVQQPMGAVQEADSIPSEVISPVEKNNKWLIIGGIVALMFILLGGVFAYQQYTSSQTISLDNSHMAGDIPKSDILNNDSDIQIENEQQVRLDVGDVKTPQKENVSAGMSDWKTYTNSYHNFTMKYPPEMLPEEREDNQGYTVFLPNNSSFQTNPQFAIDSRWGVTKDVLIEEQKDMVNFDEVIERDGWTIIAGTVTGDFSKGAKIYTAYYDLPEPDFAVSIQSIYEVITLDLFNQIISTFEFIEPIESNTQNLKTFSNPDYPFMIHYPADLEVKEQFSDMPNVKVVTVEKWGPTHKPNTEFYDGVNIIFLVTSLNGQTLDEYVDKQIEDSKAAGDILEEKAVVYLNNIKGLSYTSQAFGIYKPTFFQNGDQVIKVINNTKDPNNQDFDDIAETVLGTFQLK